jgi:uncharacterized protein with HEPN domain
MPSRSPVTLSRKTLDADRKLTLSLVKSIEIVGEAASKICKESQQKCPSIPWANIIAMRNRLIHTYYDIDLDRVWDTVTSDLPPLIAELEKVIPNTDHCRFWIALPTILLGAGRQGRGAGRG